MRFDRFVHLMTAIVGYDKSLHQFGVSLGTVLSILISGANLGFVQSREVYVGCFKDDPDRMFDFPSKDHGMAQPGSMTKRFCANFCHDFIYFGLQFGDQCFCGNDYPNNRNYPNVSTSDCNMPCDGDRSTNCGGSYHMSIYKDCNRILRGTLDFCAEVDCKSRSNKWCTKCSDQLMYKLNSASWLCEHKCSSNGRWCWPGKCADDFAIRCNCMKGFTKKSTSCQPMISPVIDSCQARAYGVNSSGERWSHKGAASCVLQKDFFGRFQVEYFTAVINAHFKVDIEQDIKDKRPKFVESEKFGVTDVSVIVRKIFLSGVSRKVKAKQIVTDSSPIENFCETVNISNNETVSDGERLCLRLLVKGGGYLVSKNLKNNNLEHVSYDKTENSEEVCYIYDRTPPKHCFGFQTKPCQNEPLRLSTSLTDSKEIQVELEGWEDPLPSNDLSLGSGINEYEISIHEVILSNDILVRDKNAYGKTYKFESNQTSVSISLPGKLFPMLYVILLAVKDHANNVRHARRFVLFDNSSAINANNNNPLQVTTTSSKSNFQWQTNHGPFCFLWQKHFYNNLYRKNFNPLFPIRGDHYDIKDEYDQTKGILPVNGTINKDGITGVIYYLKKNNNMVLKGRINNFTSESTCLTVNMNDGDTFEFELTVNDIMNHTLNDSVEFNIDRSVPEITDAWLVRDEYEEIYVHHSEDLSKMSLKFKAYDIHSGIREVKWAFGIYENHTVLIEKALGVTHVDDPRNCFENATSDCYCPKIGRCSLKTYQANLTKINAKIGNHNRRYFFTMDVMNNARLISTQHVDILVDTSPPEIGVVFEGPVDSRDIDYTRSDDFVIHWRGFVDHESGIKFYRVALARECLQNLDNMTPGTFNASRITETVHTFTRIAFPDGEGQYFTTVIAFNNALSPSRVACSDGITFDKSTPTINNVRMRHAHISESTGCFDEEAWLINPDVTKSKLESAECNNICKNQSNDEILAFIPESSLNTSTFSFWCKTVPKYKKDTIYLPSDLLNISFSVSEDRSQIAHVSIGFATQISESNSPDIQDFTQIQNLDRYIQRHPGLIGESEFYVFIKATNRAGLDTTISFGPLIADETPPVCVPNIKPLIDHEDLIMKWTRNTFEDTEQREEIGKMMFRIGVENHFVTPLLEWKISSHGGDCGLGYRCIKYPINKLQKYDSITGSPFYIQLHVYNYAGHFCTVDTDYFWLPSIFPPRAGVVKDIDPDSESYYKDVDVTFNSSTFCYAWTGFDHHRNVNLQVGLGTQQKKDDVVAFHVIKPNHDHEPISCEEFNGTINEKYYVTIMANCSCGITYGTSDGFIVLNDDEISSSIRIYHGQNFTGKCKKQNTQIVIKSFNQIEVHFSENLEPGKIYSIPRKFNSTLATNINIYRKGSFFDHSRRIDTFIPLNEMKNFSLEFDYNLTNLIPQNNLEVWKCDPEMNVQSSTTEIPIYWTLPERFTSLVTHFETVVCEMTKKDKNCKNTILFRNTGNKYDTMFHGQFTEGFYKTAVRPCFGFRCLSPTWSKEIEIRSLKGTQPEIQSSGEVTETCIDFSLSITKLVCSLRNEDKFAFGYRWAIFSDGIGKHRISDWAVVIDTGNNQTIAVSKCLDLPVYYHKQLYVCVQSFCISGSVKACTPITIESDPNTFEKDVLYDLNLNHRSSKDVEKFKFTANIGADLSRLHDIEMDFADPVVKVGGLLMGQSDIDITWFLMKSKHIPKHCNSDPSCVMEKNGKTGFVSFENALLEVGLYYTCGAIHSTDSNISFNVCSDGFLIEDSYPERGTVAIESYDGFLSDGSELTLRWSGFKGNSRVFDLGYPSDLAFYQYAIGTYPGSDDTVPFTDTDLSEIKTIRQLDLINGQAYYATIRGFNHINKSTEAYSSAVIYDKTPPSIGSVGVKIDSMTGFVPVHRLEAEWSDVEDVESGIQKIEIGVGSTNQSADIMELQMSLDFDAVQNFGNFQDGHQYFIILKATNRAGLSSYKSSQAITVDSSSPEIGHVMDVAATKISTKVDIDFQTETTSISCSWYGFHDTHSHISFYKVGLGTSHGDDDVMPYHSVGLQTSKTWKSSFHQGVKYFSTVIACNGALLCSNVSSNGVIIDNSAPVPGSVYVGGQGHHTKYLSDISTLHVSWVGFQDPHSGLDYFEVCAGTKLLTCEIMERLNVSLSSSLVKGNLVMPINTKIFVTVKACNMVHLCSVRSSQSFVIDSTKPVIVTSPLINSIYKKSLGSLVFLSDPSFFKVKWEFRDDESPISRTVVTMKSTRDSHIPVDDILLTNENEFSISLKDTDLLRNGDVYVIRVTACNAASLCITAVSEEVLVDFTPPTLGGFMEPLTYDMNDSNVIFNLKWYGFVDAESEIQSYYISIGTTYSGNELLDDYFILPNSSDSIYSQETHLSFKIIEPLQDKLVLTIWAMNHAGLVTQQVKVRTDVLNTPKHHGKLLIVKHSCEPDYCNNDCTCSVVGKKCKDQSVRKCTDRLTASNISVNVSLKSDHASSAIGSSKCLRAEWFNNKQNQGNVLRFEFTFGIYSHKVGEGVFDLSKENPWFDVGRRINGSHCLSSKLKHAVSYVAYVRTWTSYFDYFISASQPVVVDHTQPTVRKRHFVNDVSDSRSDEVDFIVSNITMSADWVDIFLDQESSIKHFTASLGTSPSLDDVVPWTNVGLSTRLQWSNVTFEPGTKYYATVRAVNVLGLQTELSSDGFLLDSNPPDTGVVYNTKYYRDVTYQSENETVAFSWHGFDDQHSYIDAYLVSFNVNDNNNSFVTFQNNGLLNNVIFGGNLKHNDKIMVSIKARDTAGHESSTVQSQQLLIDNTPPQALECYNFVDVIHQNIEATESTFIWSKTVVTNRYDLLKISFYINDIQIQFRAYLTVNKMMMVFPFLIRSDGSVVLEHNYLTAEVGQTNISVVLYDIKPDTNISIIVSKCAHLNVGLEKTGAILVQQITENSVSVCVLAFDPESGIKAVLVEVGSVHDGFEVQSFKPMSSHSHEIIRGNFTHGMRLFVKIEVTNHAGLRSVFRANPIIIDHTAPILKDLNISVEYVVRQDNTIIKVSASWEAVDSESEVKFCEYCVGLMQGSFELVSWNKTTSLTSFGIALSNVKHGSVLFSTVRCINTVELVRYALFEPLVVSYIPPVVYDPELRFVANRMNSLPGQSVKSVTAWWNGLEDISGMKSYKVLVANETAVIWNWQDIGNKNYVKLDFPENVMETKHLYKIKVSGINTGQQESSTINGSILLDYTKPKVTGNQIDVHKASNKDYLINWEDVFMPGNKDKSYEVSIGSSRGATDVLMPITTYHNKMSVTIPKAVNHLFIVITATSKTGMSQTYRENIVKK